MGSSLISVDELHAYAPAPNLEELLTVDFGLTTPTVLQRAVCCIADGRPMPREILRHPHVLSAIGSMPANYGRFRPKTIAFLSAIRGGKSLLTGAAGVRCALTWRAPQQMLDSDVPRVSIISIKRDQAGVIFSHIAGAFSRSERLRAMLIDEPRADRILMRHPSGRPVEIMVVAGAKAGGTLTARYMAAVLFDEAPRMVGADDGKVNLEHERDAIRGRLMDCDCTSEWLTGSPWAPFGPVHEVYLAHFQKPNPAAVVVKARGDWLNPVWWTPERIDEVERDNPTAYRTDFLAEFADAEEALISSVELERCTRASGNLPPERGYEYAAEMDPATRSNGWTLCVSKREGTKSIIVLAKEWRGTRASPLSPERVFQEMAGILEPYGVTSVGTDQWSADANADLAKQCGLRLDEWPATGRSNSEGYMELRARISVGDVELPNDPVLLADLRRIRRVTTQAGIAIHLPNTNDGRHCDYAPAVMRVAQRLTDCPKPVDERPEWKRQQDAIFQSVRKKYGAKPAVPFWKRAPH